MPNGSLHTNNAQCAQYILLYLYVKDNINYPLQIRLRLMVLKEAQILIDAHAIHIVLGASCSQK